MSENKLTIIALIVFMICQFGFFWYTKDSFKGLSVRYDCSISEISPDFPIQVKEECRKLRAKYSDGRI
jgi:hypothetical protein